MYELINAICDEGSFFEIKKLFARELITGFARIDGRAVGIVANQPKWKGGVLFVDSADKAARFIWLCDAFNIPLLFLADVPGFMIGKAVERQGHHPPRGQDDLGDGRRDGAQDLRGGAQGLRRGPVRHVRAGLRRRRHHGPAAGDDRRHGRRGGGQRRLRQQDRRQARGRAGRLRRGAARASTATTSTSSSWPPTCTSTRSCPATTCAPSWSAGFAVLATKTDPGYPRRRAVTAGVAGLADSRSPASRPAEARRPG